MINTIEVVASGGQVEIRRPERTFRPSISMTIDEAEALLTQLERAVFIAREEDRPDSGRWEDPALETVAAEIATPEIHDHTGSYSPGEHVEIEQPSECPECDGLGTIERQVDVDRFKEEACPECGDY